MAADSISDAGLAISRPAISGAEPCCACATAKSRSGIEGSPDAEAAGDFARLIGENVAEHVGGDDDVELARIADQQCRHGVDQALFTHDIRMPRRLLAHAVEEKPLGQPQHIGLVNRRHLAPPPRREREGRLGDALAALAADLADRQREVGRRHELARPRMHGAVRVKALGVLAHDHEIDVAPAPRRQSRARARGPDIGEQIEPPAQLARRIEPALRNRRIFVVRNRPENDPVGGLGLRDHIVGHGGADDF